MNNSSGPIRHPVPATPYYTQRPNSPRHTTFALLPRRRGRHRSARPYLAMLPEPETLALPAITEDTAPPTPAPPEPRAVGPSLECHERTGPAEDMGELAALCQQLITRRPDLARPVHTLPGAGR